MKVQRSTFHCSVEDAGELADRLGLPWMQHSSVYHALQP